MRFKRGDTFDYSGAVTASVDDELVTDFTDWSAACQFRSPSGELVATAEVTWLFRAPGVIRLRVEDTSEWPLTVLRTDIKLTAPDGSRVTTETAQITVEEDITQ